MKNVLKLALVFVALTANAKPTTPQLKPCTTLGCCLQTPHGCCSEGQFCPIN